MSRIYAILFFLCTSVTTVSATSGADVYRSRKVSTPQDFTAIEHVISTFSQAIIQKDGHSLSSTVLNSHILFTSPGDQASIDKVRGFDTHFDGLSIGGFTSFAGFISTTTDKIEERFYNVHIDQDGALAWVDFDFEFYRNDIVSNYGVEHWQLLKVDGQWKIFSVIWTSHAPAP